MQQSSARSQTLTQMSEPKNSKGIFVHLFGSNCAAHFLEPWNIANINVSVVFASNKWWLDVVGVDLGTHEVTSEDPALYFGRPGSRSEKGMGGSIQHAI